MMLKQSICEIIIKNAQDVIEGLDTSKLRLTDKFPEIGAGEVEQALIIALVLDQLCLEIPVSNFGCSDSIEGLAEKIVSKAMKLDCSGQQNRTH